MSSDRQQPARRAMPAPPRRRAVVFYRQRGVEVTDRYLVAGAYRYDIAELADLRLAKGTLHPGVIVGLVIAVAEAAFVAPFVGIVHSPYAWLAAVVALAIPCVVGLFCSRRWPVQLELLAEYRGRQVLLFASRDALEFGQVTRAVRRAVEAGFLRYRASD